MYSKMLLSEKVAQNLSAAIRDGFFAPGTQLPTEMELTEKLGVSRATLREAIKLLESMNVIEVRRGVGTFVSAVPGLSKDPLGLRFVDGYAHRFELVKWLVQLHTEAIEHFSMRSNAWTLAEFGADLSFKQLVEHLFRGFENDALENERPIAYRLQLTAHQAFYDVFDVHDGRVNPIIMERFQTFIRALDLGKKKDANREHASLMQLIVITASEEDEIRGSL